MAQRLILIDTSILIDYFRKRDKESTVLLSLVRQEFALRISAITEFELFAGVTEDNRPFWEELLEQVETMPFGSVEVQKAVAVQKDLKRARKQLDIPDLFIAATALAHNLPLATLNRKHFERVAGLKVV